ncbi:uncharacterized protein [Brachyistius frenatus]|uniref:uncharacterized protein n=1 Tax=Brachyistius frenatus TaxID=100188 RepID=UPI0037E7FACB
MSGFSHILLRFCVLGCIFCSSRAWQVKMPSHIKGLLGSCLVIPCTFNYNQYPPENPNRVVWYQHVSNGYPLVCDRWYPDDVIKTFRGRTQVLTSYYEKTCSLKIEPVIWSDHSQKIYPWVDPENVGRGTYRFFDTTVTVEVVDRADPPHITIFGNMKVGQSVTVHCAVYHSCPTKPPNLSLNVLQNQRVTQIAQTDGRVKMTLTATLLIERDHQTVECLVRHTGGLTARAYKTLSAECSISQLTISPTSDEFLEGYPSKVTCTASYTCAKDKPTLTWNYGSMPATTDDTKLKIEWRTVSTLTFTSSANDHGRSLTCYARFAERQTQQASITIRVKRNMHMRGWSFTTPASITGLKGSCIIIPCQFTYSISQPADLRVIWYLYQSKEYPAVFDQGANNVISKFKGRTNLIGSVRERNCSLKIERLEMSHNQDRLYPWIDKNPITSYHSMGHTFNDKTTQLIVLDHAQEPQLSIIGIPRMGEQSRVSCTVRHTCLSAPPVLTLNGIPGTDQITDTLVSDGIWERTVERTWTAEEENQSVKCTVSYPSGQKSTSELLLNVECPFQNIIMVQPPGEATEGVAKSVICSVVYKCKKNTPTIVWNYKDMQSSLKNKMTDGNTYNAVSNLTFIGSLGDDGKSLTCTAQFTTGETSDSAALHIKKYVKPVVEIDPHENDTFHVLAADVPFRFSALTRSCVVIPCSFQEKEDVPMTRGIWSKKTGGIVYHNGQSNVIDHFKGRTKILGDLVEGNCSLEIDDIKPFDNGPFCFHAEKGHDKYQFNNSCVFIVMKASPEKPAMTTVPAEVDAGSTITVSCSVTHTCQSHHPEFSWSVPHLTSEVSHTSTSRGIWETTSKITFMVAEGDGVRSLTCTAIFWRGKEQASTVNLNVKGSMMFQLRSSLPVAIPVSLVVLIVIILAAVFGVFIYRKRKQTDDSLRPPPRPEKRRSLLDRLSRSRRYQEDKERPPRAEKRKSIWSPFSRTTEEDGIGWQNERTPRKSFWSRYSRNNSTTATRCDVSNSKQRFPSPKDNRRRPHPASPEDCQIYNNL